MEYVCSLTLKILKIFPLKYVYIYFLQISETSENIENYKAVNCTSKNDIPF